MSPQDNTGERLAKMETVLSDRSARDAAQGAFQQTVLEKLAVIVYQQTQFNEYQKTCEATSDAHGVRLNNVENAMTGFVTTRAICEDHNQRIYKLESAYGGFNTARKTLLWFCSIIGAIAVFMVSIAALVIKHG